MIKALLVGGPFHGQQIDVDEYRYKIELAIPRELKVGDSIDDKVIPNRVQTASYSRMQIMHGNRTLTTIYCWEF
jgi:hypothetical protein